MTKTLVALVLTMALASTALAHEGHAHNVMGTVTMLHENHLEVKAAKDGKAVVVVLNDKTKILKGTTPASRTDITTGARVVVIYVQQKDASGKDYLAAQEVRLGAPSSLAAR